MYKIFTPYYNVVKKIPVPKPKNKLIKFYSNKINSTALINLSYIKRRIKYLGMRGGRAEGIKQLHAVNSISYSKDTLFGGTSLSPYLKFNVLSIREVYYFIKQSNIKNKTRLIRQLYWRDFYMQYLNYYGYVKEYNPSIRRCPKAVAKARFNK